MAFRKFSQPTPMRAAKFEGMPNLISALQRNQLLKSREDAAKKLALDKKRKEIDKVRQSRLQGSFIQDTPIINANFEKGTKFQVDAILRDVPLSEEGNSYLRTAMLDKQKSDDQFKQMEGMYSDVDKREETDIFYNPDYDRAVLTDEGRKDINERDFNKIEIGGSESFLKEKFYSALVEKNIREVGDGIFDKSGKVIGNWKAEGSFIDDTGKITVTDPDAQKVLDGQYGTTLHELYDKVIDAQYDKEINNIVASNVDWVKGKSHNEIKTYLINNPEENTENPLDDAERKLELVKEDIRGSARTLKKVNTYYKALQKKTTEPSKSEVAIKRKEENRNSLIDNIVFDKREDALSSVFGGLKGVNEYKFVYEEPSFPDYEERKIIGIEIKIDSGDKNESDVKIPLKTKNDELKARVIINKLLDDEVKGTTNYVGPEGIVKENDEIIRKQKEGKNAFGIKWDN